MTINLSAFLSSHWEGNSDLREWFRSTLEAVGLTVIEADKPEANSVSSAVENRIENADLYVGLLTLGGGLSWVHQELGFAHAKGKRLVVFYEISGSQAAEFNGFGPYETISCKFDRDDLGAAAPDVIRYIKSAIDRVQHEQLAEHVGFRVVEHEVSVRYGRWLQDTHEEVYCKRMKILPLRDGELLVDIKSGSSMKKEAAANPVDYISHSHPDIQVVKEIDNFHSKSTTRIANSKEGVSQLLWEKSIRSSVPNLGRDCIHPDLPKYNADAYYAITCHILYPTERLIVYAEFSQDRLIELDAPVTAIQHKFGRQIHLNNARVYLSPTREFLGWEVVNAEPNTDYLLVWKWEDGRGLGQQR